MTYRAMRATALVAGLTLAGGCAAPAPEGALIADPYERANRQVHAFNVGVDTVLLRPAARGYDIVTPALFQHMIGNLVDHVRAPVDLINHVLQGDADGALATAGRFGVNTIVGAGGLLDPATEFGLPREANDFGLTLARWGVAEGVFFMVPIFGPSTTRDIGGRIGDFAMNPLTYVTIGGGTGETVATVAQTATPPVVFRAENLSLIDQLFYETEDSYIATRSGFVQSRRAQVAGGRVDVDALPDIFAE